MNILKDPKFKELLGKAIAEEAREMDKIRREADEKRNKVNQRLEEYDKMFRNQQRGQNYENDENHNNTIWNCINN